MGNCNLDWVSSFPSFLIQKYLGEFFILWGLYASFIPTFQEKEIFFCSGERELVSAVPRRVVFGSRDKGFLQVIALSQVERGNLKPTGGSHRSPWMAFTILTEDIVSLCSDIYSSSFLYVSSYFVSAVLLLSFFSCPFPILSFPINLFWFLVESANGTSNLVQKVLFECGQRIIAR